MSDQNVEIKEDFSGFTEVTVNGETERKLDEQHEHAEGETPHKMDVSEAIAQAQSHQSRQSHDHAEDDEPGMLPGVPPRGMMPPPPRQTFWQSFLGRVIIVVGALGALLVLYYIWSTRNGAHSDAGIVETVSGAVENLTNTVKKSLKLPPNL